MRNIRKRLGLGILSLALWAAAPVNVMAGQTGSGTAYQSSMNGINIYVSEKENTMTLSRYSVVIGAWPAKLSEESATGDKVQQGDEITPSGKFYVYTMNDKNQYYLTLGLSCPDIEGAERGLAGGLINQEQHQGIVDANRAGERPLWGTPLGGAIEIRGEQGGSTAECITVINDIMGASWQYYNLGAPVTIGPQWEQQTKSLRM